MLSKKLFRWVHKIALFAVFFASLAPSISHALAAKQGINSFAQEICTTDGQTITIQVVTTKGKQLATELTAGEPNNQMPASIVHHLNHCPFCNVGMAEVVIPNQNHAFTLYLAQQTRQQRFDYQIPAFSTCPQSAHLTRGPPVITL
jgi:Protein of unknown function (DUF2946)